MAKSFDFSAPIGSIVPKDESEPEGLLWSSASSITLKVNGGICQDSSLDHMIWSVPEIISHFSSYFRLRAGDLIMTGTPESVSALDIEDSVTISCGGLPLCDFVIGEAETLKWCSCF